MTKYRKNPTNVGYLSEKQTEEVFASPDDMADSIDALVSYLNCRYAKAGSTSHLGVMGFIVENLKVEFSSKVKHLEVVTGFAESSATILVPIDQFDNIQLQDKHRAELLKFFLPTLKDAQIRATVQLYKILHPDARKTLVSRFPKPSSLSKKAESGSPQKILVIEDNEDILLLVTNILKGSGYDVITAANGEEAFTYLKGPILPELIIVDLDMPVMDGREFCLTKSKIKRLAGIPVMIHSAHQVVDQEQKALGASVWINKVLDPEPLLKTVASLLKRDN